MIQAAQKRRAAKKKRAAQRERAAQEEMAAKQQQLPPTPPPTPSPTPLPLLTLTRAPRTTTPPLTQFNEIKAMIEPYWRLFNSIMENQPRNNLVFHPGTLSIEGYGIPTLGFRPASDSDLGLPNTVGIDHYTPEIQARARIGSLKHNHCDYSIHLFLTYLEPVFRKFGAKIEWFAVGANPMVLFHSLPRPAQLNIRHSVFSITTARGEEFIADFTIEQFGFPGSSWFTQKTAYVAQCTIGLIIKQPSAKEVARAKAGVVKQHMPRDAIAFVVCESGYLEAWMTHDEEERLNHIDEVVKVEFALLERRNAWARKMRSLCCYTGLSSVGSESPDHGSDSESTVSSSPSSSDTGPQSSQSSWGSDTEYESQSSAGSTPHVKYLRRYYYEME